MFSCSCDKRANGRIAQTIGRTAERINSSVKLVTQSIMNSLGCTRRRGGKVERERLLFVVVIRGRHIETERNHSGVTAVSKVKGKRCQRIGTSQELLFHCPSLLSLLSLDQSGFWKLWQS